MEKNGEYKGKVLSLGTEGEGIIKCGDTTCFVPFCLIGEEVLFKALKSGGGVCYGKLTEVHTVSEERVIPVCPVFEKCGGCQMQHASYKAQLEFKKQLVVNALKKIGGIDCEVDGCVPSEREYGYRNKLVLPVGVNFAGRAVCGFYAPRSHRIVPIESCALQKDWSGEIISALLDFMNSEGYSGYDEQSLKGDIRHIAAREIEGKLIISVVATSHIKLEGLTERLNKKFRKYALWLNINNSRGNAIFGKEWILCHGERYFSGENAKVKFRAGANTFLQVNDGVRDKLYARAAEEAKGKDKVVIDLYSGGGTLTAMLAMHAKKAYGVEIVAEAVDCANELKELNGLGDKIENLCGDVAAELSGLLARCEGEEKIIVCDPPRKGMERRVVKEVAKSGAGKIILISCNPATLARDLGLLCGTLKEVDGQLIKGDGVGDYEIKSVTPYDMFPQTKHVETLVVLTRY